ncbi:MAG: large-conductance mechanosensitive channel protein MscL [Alphaproteobacteria bacterium]|nr:large-conductance mechanosensitive channel protein MscL [Alphaproteobacteria bacterium]
MKSFLNEFKKFAMRGNVIDMAVGIIIGAAFGKIVNSLVEDVLMPPIGLILGKVDFSDLKITLANDVAIKYGAFINALISFLIVAFAVFLLIQSINKLQEKMVAKDAAKEKANPTTKTCPYCFSEISINATRCPHCTSEIAAQAKKGRKPGKKAKQTK